MLARSGGWLRLLTITGAAALACWRVEAAEPARAFHEAEFVLADSENPPPADAAWQTKPLPDCWAITNPDVGGTGWYRLHFDAGAGSGAWAIYVAQPGFVLLNGAVLSPEGSLEAAVRQPWHRPVLLRVPASLLRDGRNEILIGIRGLPNSRAGLYGVSVGPLDALSRDYERVHALKVSFMQAVVVSSSAIGLLFLFVWLQRRQDVVYGLFALSCAILGVRGFLFLVRNPPLDGPLLPLLWSLDSYWGILVLVFAFHRFIGLGRPIAERVIVAYATAATAIAPLLLDHFFALQRLLWAGLAIALYMLVTTSVTAWRMGRDAQILSLGFAQFAALAAWDFAMPYLPAPRPDWAPALYGWTVLWLVFTWLLAGRFIQALAAAEASSEQLAQQVAQKTAELESSYRSMQELQRHQAVAAERERIMRDLHDGLGGQLVSALALSQGGNPQAAVTQTLRDALDDLRIVIDSLDPIDGDLLVLLGTVRARLESRLRQHGLHFDWQVSDIPPIVGLGSDKALQVLRVVQEAIANVLKHARARTVTVRTGVIDGAAAPRVFVEVADDGAGMGESPGSGRGLRNMRERAARIGAVLELTSNGQGTTVRLSLPLSTPG